MGDRMGNIECASRRIKPAACDCEYPCSCVEFDGKRYGGMSAVVDAIDDQRRAAVEEVEHLRTWADKYGTRTLRRSDIDVLLEDSRLRVPPPAGGQ